MKLDQPTWTGWNAPTAHMVATARAALPTHYMYWLLQHAPCQLICARLIHSLVQFPSKPHCEQPDLRLAHTCLQHVHLMYNGHGGVPPVVVLFPASTSLLAAPPGGLAIDVLFLPLEAAGRRKRPVPRKRLFQPTSRRSFGPHRHSPASTDAPHIHTNQPPLSSSYCYSHSPG
jgi:hypothetical protein